MKKIILLIVLTAAAFLCAQTTLVFTVGEWAPYSSASAKGYGIMPQVVTAAFQEVGIEVKYEWMPWNRAMEIVKNNPKYAGTVGWGKTDERIQFFLFSESQIVSDKVVLFHRKDYDFSWENKPEDLLGKKVGHTRGYAYIGVLQESVEKGLILDVADSELVNFKKLVNGRIDIFDCNIFVGKEIIKNKLSPEQRNKLTFKDKFLSDKPLMLLVSNKHPNAKGIISKFDEGMKIIKQNGVYDKIINP